MFHRLWLIQSSERGVFPFPQLFTGLDALIKLHLLYCVHMTILSRQEDLALDLREETSSLVIALLFHLIE